MTKVTITLKVDPVGIPLSAMPGGSFAVLLERPDGVPSQVGYLCYRHVCSGNVDIIDCGTYVGVDCSDGYRVRPLVTGDKITIEI